MSDTRRRGDAARLPDRLTDTGYVDVAVFRGLADAVLRLHDAWEENDVDAIVSCSLCSLAAEHG
jgi:hypothetical protein